MKGEIMWNVVNSLIAGGLVFVGAISDGNITWTGILAAALTSLGVSLNLFKDYWKTKEGEYKYFLFKFV